MESQIQNQDGQLNKTLSLQNNNNKNKTTTKQRLKRGLGVDISHLGIEEAQW